MTARATVYDVAERAGVSIKTVSRVVNGAEAVAAPTRERVLEAVRELKYVPNSHALSLRSGSSRTVGVVVDSLDDPFFAAIVAVVEDVLASNGYTVLVASTNRSSEREREQVLALTRHRIAGIVLAPAPGDHSYLTDALHGVPLIAVDRSTETADHDVVRVDDHGASRSAVTDLISLGHTRIAFIGDSRALPTNSRRRDGYLAALNDAGIQADPRLERWDSDKADQAQQATLDLLGGEQPPTAFFCCHPRGAAGTLRALHRARRTDCAVISFGDVALGDLLTPGLTAIDHRPELIAQAAVEQLLTRLREAQTDAVPEPVAEIVVPLSVIRRGSGEIAP